MYSPEAPLSRSKIEKPIRDVDGSTTLWLAAAQPYDARFVARAEPVQQSADVQVAP